MYKELENKVAVVTGGSKGIGTAIAQRLGKEKMNVVVNDNSDKEGAEKQSKQSKKQAEKQSLYKQMSVLRKEYSVYLIRL